MTALSRAPTDAEHPLWRWLLLACAVATAAPLWAGRYLPFTDLPQHVATISTLRHWGDPQWSWPYELALGSTQYLLYYLAGALLAFPFGAERANTLLLTATALALPFALRSLLRALRADERLSLFAPVLFWSESLLIGFFNYLAALPVLLWALAHAVRQAQSPTRRDALLLAALSVVLFYLHLSAFAFFGLSCVIAFLALPEEQTLLQRLQSLPRRGLWAIPAVLLVGYWLVASPVMHPGEVGFRAPSGATWQPPIAALHDLFDALLDIWRGPEDEWCLLAFVALLGLTALPGERPADEPGARRRRAIAAGWTLLAGALYFAMPISIGWLWALNHRYAIVTLLLLPTLLRPLPGLRGALPIAAAAGLGLFASAHAAKQIRFFNEQEVGAFDAVLARAQPGKRLLGLMFDRDSRTARFVPFMHFQSYYRARYGGIAEFSFTELPQSPLRYRPGVVPPQRPLNWEWRPDWFRNEREGEYYDYILVRGAVDPMARSRGGPAWQAIAAEGPWRLYARK